MDVPRLLFHLFFKLPITQLAHTLLLLSFLCSAVITGYMYAPFFFMSISLNTHLHTPILQFYYINVSECVGFLINAGKEKQRASSEFSYVAYHFGVKVFDVLRVENGHEGLCAHSLAAVFLADHQSYVLWIVLKVVDERLALASDGLGDKTHTILTD